MSKAVRIWQDNFEILSKIRSKSERNALCFALISYGFSGEIPQDLRLNKNNLLLFEVLKNNFISKNQGGAPLGNFNRCSTVEKNKSTDNQPLSENIKQKENIQSNDCIKKREVKKFVKPSFDEVDAYCKERGNGVDADRFISYYEANGWKVGRNPMKDWRAAVRTWERGTDSVRPAVTVAANDGWTAEDEERHQKTMSIVEATKRMLAEQTKARFGV